MMTRFLRLVVSAIFLTGLLNSYAADKSATLTIFYSNDVMGYLSPCG